MVSSSKRALSLLAAVSISMLAVLPAGCVSGETAPPSNLSYAGSPFVLYTNIAMPQAQPSVIGPVDQYTVTPALPAGLAIDQYLGVISGTPTAAQAQTTYTVTATNAVGSTQATISITVFGPPSGLSYAGSPFTFTVGTPITPAAPTVTGFVTSYAIVPVLPAGLSIDPVAGTISGTPTAATSILEYVVTAQNPAGYTTGAIVITVK